MIKKSLFLLMFILFYFNLSFLFGEENTSHYGHISYVESDSMVIRENGRVDVAIVNLPVAPGDIVATGSKGRCELQFDNGTIIRFDNNTKLKVITTLAKCLTSKSKITTLELLSGQIYCMNRVYFKEIIQIITPNATLNLNKSSVSIIKLSDNKNTILNVIRGKIGVMFGKDLKDLKIEKATSGRIYEITKDHRFIPSDTKSPEFLIWNQSINKNFKELHFGKNKVPKKIYRYPKGIVHFAEKWSNLFGEWIYNDIFGYVWKPYNEFFIYTSPIYFQSEYVKINGELVLVPSQPWGWAPFHLGTWVFLPRYGWTWIPGSAFTTGIGGYGGYSFAYFWDAFCYGGCYYFDPIYHAYRNIGFEFENYLPTLGYWMNRAYGGYGLYYIFREKGKKAWRIAYEKKYNIKLKNPVTRILPTNIKKILKRMNRIYVSYLKKSLSKTQLLPLKLNPLPISERVDSSKVLGLLKKSTKSDNVKEIQPKTEPVGQKVRQKSPKTKMKPINKSGKTIKWIKMNQVKRDFNPDKLWAIRKGVSIIYQSKRNTVVCPELNLSSRTMSESARMRLGSGRASRSSGGSSGSSHSGSSSSSSSTSFSGSGTTGTSKSKE